MRRSDAVAESARYSYSKRYYLPFIPSLDRSPLSEEPETYSEADIAAPAGLFIYCFELRIILRMPDKKHKTLSYV